MSHIKATDFFTNRAAQILSCYNPIQKSEPVVELQKSEEANALATAAEVEVEEPTAEEMQAADKEFEFSKSIDDLFAPIDLNIIKGN